MAQDLASLVSSPDWVHWIAGHGDLFHMAFMPARDFGRFARERDIQAEDDDIGQLWTLCLLEADGVWSRRRSARRGLEPVSRTPDGIFYADLRRPRHRSRGWASAATKRTLPPQTLTPLFHPYRYYALARLRRILGGHTALMQTLLYASGHRVINEITLRQFRRHTSSPSFVKDVREWNAVVRLAVLAEPFSFPRMYLRSKASPPQAAEEHQKRVQALYAALSLNDIKELCAAICVEADRLDENRNVYTLLRLAKADLRLKLRGALGGAFLLRGMAEAIRRMAEEAHGTKLPEEDELGFGWAPPDLKLRAYGNNRLFDGDRAAKREFVRQLGADYGSRLRWSVEGDTEEGAARLVVGAAEGSPIEVVNLQGSISEGKKEPTFRRALEADRRHGRFSLVSIDADDVDRVAAVVEPRNPASSSGRSTCMIPTSSWGLRDTRVTDLADIGRSLVYGVVLNESQGGFRFAKASLPDEAKVQLDKLMVDVGRGLVPFTRPSDSRRPAPLRDCGRPGGSRKAAAGVSASFRA